MAKVLLVQGSNAGLDLTLERAQIEAALGSAGKADQLAVLENATRSKLIEQLPLPVRAVAGRVL